MRPSAYCLCLLASLAGCSAPSPWTRSAPPLYTTPQLVLYREHLEKDGRREALGYKHPIRVSPEKLSAVLGQLSYNNTNLFKSRREPVFPREQLPIIAEPLSIALGEIGPDERLRFVAIQSGLLGRVFRPYGTAGVIFSRDEGTLDIAFVEIDDALDLPDDSNPMKIRFDDEPTELTGVSSIVPAPGMELRSAPGVGTYPRWVAVRVDEAAAHAPPPAPPATAAPAVARPSEVPPAPSATGVPATPPASTPEQEQRYARIREKVETLNRLRKDGVLTEDQYKAELEKTLGDVGK